MLSLALSGVHLLLLSIAHDVWRVRGGGAVLLKAASKWRLACINVTLSLPVNQENTHTRCH